MPKISKMNRVEIEEIRRLLRMIEVETDRWKELASTERHSDRKRLGSDAR